MTPSLELQTQNQGLPQGRRTGVMWESLEFLVAIYNQTACSVQLTLVLFVCIVGIVTTTAESACFGY